MLFFACSASQAREAFAAMEEARTISSTSRQKHRGEMQGSGERTAGWWWWWWWGGKRQRSSSVCLPLSHIPHARRRHGGKPAVQAVDIINNSVVFLQRRWSGVLIASVAGRHLKKDCDDNMVLITNALNLKI